MSTLVLIHGAWTDSRIWSRVQRHLAVLGYDSLAPDLPAHAFDCGGLDQTLDAYVDAIVEAARSVAGPVVLVGHSTAGAIVSMVAERHPDLVAHLVYVAGFLLQSGQSCWDVVESSRALDGSGLGRALRRRNGMLMIDPFSFIRVFCADVQPDVVGTVVNSLRPEPIGPLTASVASSPERWGCLPRSYVFTSRDTALSATAQHQMVKGVGVQRVATMNTSHFPMLSEPAELARVLVELTQHAPTKALYRFSS